MAVELRMAALPLLAFPRYDLTFINSRSLLLAPPLTPRTHLRRTSRSLLASPLPSSLPTATDSATSTELAGDQVMHLFLQDRQLNGDIVSRAFDLLHTATTRKNQSELHLQRNTTTDQIANDIGMQHHEDEETTGGYLRLVTTRNWISGSSDAPINKKHTVKDWQNESDKITKLNLLKYEALKGELLFLTIGIGAACSMYCLIILSFEAAVSYSAGVFFSCLYLQLLYWHTDKISKDDVPEIFQMKKTKRKYGITSDDVRDNFKKVLSGAAVSLSSPRLVIPALVYGLWALSQHFHNDILNFQLAPGVMGFFAYKAAALLQAYRDNEDLRMIFPENEESDAS